MRYRIKIVTFKNGRKEYTPQYRKFFMWLDINYMGKAHIMYEIMLDKRDTALHYIDLHYSGNNKVQYIEFEFINREMKYD